MEQFAGNLPTVQQLCLDSGQEMSFSAQARALQLPDFLPAPHPGLGLCDLGWGGTAQEDRHKFLEKAP